MKNQKVKKRKKNERSQERIGEIVTNENKKERSQEGIKETVKVKKESKNKKQKRGGEKRK